MEKKKYHLPPIRAMYSDTLLSVMKRYEDSLNICIDGDKELWGQSPAELLHSKRLPRQFSRDIQHYASALYCLEMFINSVSPSEKLQTPKDELAFAIKRDIGSFEEFCYRFVNVGREFLGVGFLWLLSERGRVCLHTTRDYEIPRKTPLLCFSLWENAYIEKYGDNKAAYLSDCLRGIDWNYALENYRKSR